MATLVLGAVGTLIGGPLGGAVGALLGRQVDSAIIGSGSRDGPRLKELSITTSTYGAPIAKHYGQMRTGGTIIWATDLQENRETTGGGKGKPKTTNYSYSSSFAVAISSRPIIGIGRIWADGNLLRGAGGDLKSAGSLRIYDGYGDQHADPLMASVLGAQCPAMRHQAYVVFEDLQLEDFGNRIPALTFEVIADNGDLTLDHITGPLALGIESNLALEGVTGFSYDGGSLLGTIEVINSLFPTASDSGGSSLSLIDINQPEAAPIVLPSAASAWDQDDFGQNDGQSRRRNAPFGTKPNAIRYYDTGRDYQIGVQRPDGRAEPGGNRTIEFPGALDAGSARKLVNTSAARAAWSSDQLMWRIAELDPVITPGTLVQVPGFPGNWIIAGWEWRERGVELELQRIRPRQSGLRAGDAGYIPLPSDEVPGSSNLLAFELPWDGTGASTGPQIYAAISGQSSAWRGGALYTVGLSGDLESIGPAGRDQTVMGELISPAFPSPALMLEKNSFIDVRAIHGGMAFVSTTIEGLTEGRNKLLIAGEILQFAHAEKLAGNDWRLSGLLRGRGGTEAAAQIGHAAGASVVLLDGPLIDLTALSANIGTKAQIAVIGRGDVEAVIAPISNRGLSDRPLTPVHPRSAPLSNGALLLCWTRRARAAWDWRDGVDTPLNEENELYRVGIGLPDAPLMQWEVSNPQIEISLSDISGFSGSSIWVRQIGRIGQSDPILLHQLA